MVAYIQFNWAGVHKLGTTCRDMGEITVAPVDIYRHGGCGAEVKLGTDGYKIL